MAIVIVGLALFMTFVLFSRYGLINRLELESAKNELKDKIAAEIQRGDSLKAVIHGLKYDTTEIERIAREKYGMVKEGEKVYYIEKEKKE